jgi:transcriptional regulator with XRE-family HTH domain
MGDFRSEQTLGARIQAARKARGLRTARELASAIDGGNVSEAIIENIEAGRKASLDVSQLLNIAMALGVAPSYLLAPLGRPRDGVDLPNLSRAFEGMTAIEFDSWLSNVPDSGYQPQSMDERNASAELQALREWASFAHEVARLEVALDLEVAAGGGLTERTQARLTFARDEKTRLESYLSTAGWDL